MKTFAAWTMAGVAGLVALKLLAALLLPLLALAFGLFAFALKLSLIVLLGYVVYTVFSRSRTKAAM